MKKIIMILMFIVSSVAFPTFEIGIQVPIGISIGIPNVDIINKEWATPLYNTIEANIDYEIAVLMQIGCNYKLSNNVLKSISVLLDLGYYRHPISTMYDNNVNESIYFNSINIGIIPKLHFDRISIGIGGGVMVPIDATVYNSNGDSHALVLRNDGKKYTYLQMKRIFKYPFMPYIKLTAEGYFYITKKSAFSVGSYILYNFGMEYELDKLNPNEYISSTDPKFKKYSFSSVDIGVVLGFSFGRDNPKK